MCTLQKFASVHASVHNHLPTERRRRDRNAYKGARAAALGQSGVAFTLPDRLVGLG